MNEISSANLDKLIGQVENVVSSVPSSEQEVCYFCSEKYTGDAKSGMPIRMFKNETHIGYIHCQDVTVRVPCCEKCKSKNRNLDTKSNTAQIGMFLFAWLCAGLLVGFCVKDSADCIETVVVVSMILGAFVSAIISCLGIVMFRLFEPTYQKRLREHPLIALMLSKGYNFGKTRKS